MRAISTNSSNGNNFAVIGLLEKLSENVERKMKL